MTTAAMDAGIYTDFGGIARLRAQAASDPQSRQALRAAAQQFEAMFTQMMLKGMREASFGDELFGSETENMYRDLHDAQLALTMARGQGMGLSELIVRALSPAASVAKSLSGSPDAGDRRESLLDNRFVATISRIGRSSHPATASSVATGEPIDAPFADIAGSAVIAAAPLPESVEPAPLEVIPHAPVDVFATREDFVRVIAPHARAAAEAIGVAPEAVVAHAALESNFGRNVPRRPDGASSFNFFGVKAGGRWDGAAVTVPTLESEGGVMTRRTASFRAYGSLADGFADYARLIGRSSRYQAARAAGSDSAQYFQGLADSGYATDPNYAEKLSGVLEGGVIRKALKFVAGLPLNR
jgi:flagellar protein FlgJ